MKTPAIDHLYSVALTYGASAEEAMNVRDDLAAGRYVRSSDMDRVAAHLTAAADALVQAAKNVGFPTAFASGYDAGFENGYDAHREAEG